MTAATGWRTGTIAARAADPVVAVAVALAGVQVVVGGADLLLASALERVDPVAGVTTFGAVTATASLLALLVYPAAGWIADRAGGSRSNPAVAGAVLVAAALVAFGRASSTLSLSLLYIVALSAVPLVLVSVYAVIPDRVPVGRRGAVSALAGAAMIGGGIAGNVLASAFAGDVAAGATGFAAVIVVAAAIFAVLAKAQARADVAPSAARESHRIPEAGRVPATDLAWTLVGRFSVFLAYASVVALAYYVFRDHLGSLEPAAGVAAFAVASGTGTLVGALVAGGWSDRLDRRRPFAAAAGVLLAVGAGVAVASPTTVGFVLAGAVIGVGFGVYLAAGTALATLILRSPASTGRDISAIGLAGAAGQAVGALGGAWVASVAGYEALFAAAAIAALVGAAAAAPVRSVR